ncbi:hypothetical protein HNY73_011870 [Argiope bruennichi]|uniref:Uncharacterized protein n=1 Tax=Argiope bruennichi TaxID=94029 RepID=A0A8T0EXL9_ARGBR|nr:hypothetical protein HNY73_011870 [Argiope bruennichi]
MHFWIRFKKILKNSVITGIPQILATKNSTRKFLKTAVFIGCTVGFFWQTFSFLAVYWTYPTVVDVQYFFPDEFELPAMSVCSSNGTHPDYCDPNDNNPGNISFPTVTPHQLPPLPRSEYATMGAQPHDLVRQCLIYESPRSVDCTEKYEPVNVFDTKGLPNNCYAYNSLWGKTDGARTIKTKSLVIFELKSERTQRNQFYTGTPFALQISLHSPYSLVNPFLNGFSLKPCSNYYVFPAKQINDLLPPPYTSGCYNYTSSWYARSGKGPRNKRLCAEECFLNESVRLLGCVDPLYIAYPNTERICPDPVHHYVYQKCRNFCRPACLCFSLITLSFNRMEVVKYSYSPKYESISLFSYIGGYLGLWLGISLVAICDAIETALLIIQWLWQKIVKKRQAKNKVHFKHAFRNYDTQRQMWIL